MKRRRRPATSGRRAPLAGACLAVAGLAGAGSDEPALEAGSALERPPAPGNTHGYRLDCPAASHVRATVEQRGVDLVVTIVGPEGSEIIEADETGSDGTESVAFVAEGAGVHRLLVHSLSPDAPGGYALRLDELRPSTARDRTLFEGRRARAEGDRARRRGGAEALRKALQDYERSARLLEGLGERAEAATSFKRAGDVAAQVGDFESSVTHYGRVLELASAAAAAKPQGLAHLGLGRGLRALLQAERARGHLQQALEVFRSLGDERGVAAALVGLAVCQYEDFGDTTEGLRLLARALELSRSTGDRHLERGTLRSMAGIHDGRGERQVALDYYQQSLSLARRLGDPTEVAATLIDMGHVYSQWGDYARAADFQSDALTLARQAGNRRLEASTLVHIGRMQYLRGESRKAEATLARALALAREIGNRMLEAAALSRLGEAYDLRGDGTRALHHLRAAAEIYRGLQLAYWPALSLVHLGRACLRAGRIEEAQAALGEAWEAASRHGADGLEAAARRELARVALTRGEPEIALGHAEAAVEAVESERAKIGGDDFRTTYFASVHPYYQTRIDALMALQARQPEAGHAAAALRVSEQARARGALEALTTTAVDPRSAADPALAEREQALRRELSAVASRRERLSEQGAAAAQRAATDKTLRALAAQRQEVLNQLRHSSPAYAELVQPAILGAPGIQAELEPGTALIEYALGEDRSYLWVVTARSVAARELPRGSTIDGLARRLHRALSVRAERAPSAAEAGRRAALADRTAVRAAAELARVVLPHDLIPPEVNRLVILADGALHLVPFAVLPLPPPGGTTASPRTLGARFEVAYAPSVSWVATLRRVRTGAPPPPKALAVLADPVFDDADSRVMGGRPAPAVADAQLRRAVGEVAVRGSGAGRLLPRLPLSRREAQAVASLLRNSEVMVALDFDASRERALSQELAQYRIVHFATHSLVNNDHPDLSGVVLSLVDRRGKARDGFLRLQDVYSLRLPAELVVLSACQTAVGKTLPGEGLLGLARGFMYAGARRVLASLWPVDEAATAELMTAFYRSLFKEGRSPAAALRQAQRVVSSNPRFRAPYYWAGFVIQGEWR
jgi:CHAT domain-containing protein